MFNLFKKTPSDKNIFSKLGRTAYIRNGVGYGFISDDFLYDNCLIEIGFGRVYSNYGDWGGGFSHATESPLKITIDKNFIIKKVKTDGFDTKKSAPIEKIAKVLSTKFKIGNKLILKDDEFKNGVETILNSIPMKNHIGWDVFESPHMLEYFTDIKNKDYYNNFRKPTCLE